MDENSEQRSEPFRNRSGQFISKKRKLRMDKVVDSVHQRKRHRHSTKPNDGFTFDGRRIVELDVLANELWCPKCELPLSLRDTISETHHCIASVLEVKCQSCFMTYKVNTSKPYRSETGNLRYTSNGKTVIGMYDIGIGPCKLNDFLSCLNIPTIRPSLLKSYEAELSTTINECANESFVKAVQIEKNMTIVAKNTTETTQ